MFYIFPLKSTEKTDSGIFIDFMLGEILKMLKENSGYQVK